MGSFKRNGQSQGPNRRRNKSNAKRHAFLVGLEPLESRRLLSGTVGESTTPLWTPTSTNLFNAQNGPMANLGVQLVNVYQAYVDGNGNTSSLQAEFPTVEFQNGEVGLQVKMLGGSFSQFVTQLTDVGMNVTTTSSTDGLVEGFAPINELPTIAEMSQTQSGQINQNPIYYGSYQGEADNEAGTATDAYLAQTQFNVTGAGVTVGVMSDSVNQYNGGLSESYGTGDLNPNNPVNVLGDGPAGSDDEGRAMLENIHDIAPGANLAFDTAGESDLAAGQAITALATTGKSNIVVDDVGFFDEPFFQDGVISQAIDTATADGVSYFSAAGNDGPSNGYLSAFRAASGTPTGLTAGTYMNFNPSGGTTLELPITTYVPNAQMIFEYDQPFETQEPTGSTGVVTSDVDIYIVNAATGAVVFGAANNNNNVAIQEPWDFVTIPTAGTYDVAVQVISGPNPGHIEFVSANDTNTALTVSQEFGNAGATSYPTTYGHSAAADTIGVAAVPWWSPAPYLGQNPLASEPYSSSGPALYDLSITGTSTAATTVDNPTITAPDGGNTSFFIPGAIINTSDSPPYVPGQPSTKTNLSQDLPSFFGTSSAAPNAAAIAALMKQLVPTLTPAEVRAGEITSAATQPMNGATPGAWDPQGGYGLVNAVDALNAVDTLTVASTSPAAGSTVTTAPSYIQVTFDKPVQFSTLSAADLTFTSVPTGITVNVGAPIAVDNATDPTIVDFPISFTRAGGVLANGSYTYSVQSPVNGPVVVSEDDHDLIASGAIAFTLADTTAPTITNTTISGRTVTITFSKPIDPSTVTLGNILVLRMGSATTWPPTPATLSSYVDLNADPRTTISYDASTDTVTLNYSNLPQSELPSDNYAIVVTTAVTDLVGNALDGYYTNSFPTTAYNGGPYDFIQNLGFEALQAPQITTFTMTAATDTGYAQDQDTDDSEPAFIGQVYVPFPGTVAGDQVYVQFQGLQAPPNYLTNLAVGANGRGFTGTYNVEVTTNANGSFTVTAPSALPEGFQDAVAVVVGQADSPPLPGYASSYTDAFRIDKTAPEITAASLTQGGTTLPLPNETPTNTTDISSLSSLYLSVVDPVNPQDAPLGTPDEFDYPAINPSSASNISNYSLVNVSTNTDESQYINSATLIEEPASINAAGYVTAYNAVIDVTFTPGMPFGSYEFIAHTHELQYPGLTDAAGNYLNDTSVTYEGTKDFIVNFALQNTPVYITSMALENNYSANGSTAVGSAQSYFELPPSTGTNTRDDVSAPPNTVVIDLSNPIPYANYTPDVLLIGSANSANSAADGDFGDLGEGGTGASGSGFTIVPNTTVTLYSYNLTTGTSTQVAAGGSGNRLVLTIAPGTTLAADDYRIYMPNQVDTAGNNTEIKDIYGNQLDGEFLGNQTSQASPDFPDTPAGVTIPEFEDEQSNGTYRMDDMSGDGVAGGAFMTGFTVVPYGNIVYARPDYVENPLLPSTLSNGSLANPYPVLAPEGNPATAPANPTHNPNGGLNSSIFFNQTDFDTEYDFSGDGKFEQSAFYAASQLAYNGPVVIVALPGLPSRNPVTGAVTEASFVMESPAGSGPASGGSASVPYDTMLVLTAGTTVKLQNASLFVQNQGSALESEGTAANPVTFTSYNDASVGGATNGNPDTTPSAGDWGGIVFRNYDDAITSQQQQFPVDGILVGPNGAAAVSGEQDAMSILNYTNIRYAGGAVPQGSSNFYSGITLYNSRPMITNDDIADSGGTGGTEGAIGADFDSLREDDTARGPLVRDDTVSNNSLNGIYLMAEANGFIEPTSAMSYPTNPSTLGGSLNYTLEAPLPYIVVAQLIVGQELLEGTGGNVAWVTNRLYIQPGSMIKFNTGSGLDVLNPGASLNVGSRSYINGYDANNNYSPDSPNFVEEGASDPEVLFTSIHDDTATTPFVPAVNVLGEKTTPTLGMSMWGSVGIQSGAIAVINDATFQYGGGALNTQNFTIPSQSVLAFITDDTTFPESPTFDPEDGSHIYITNNNFYYNFDAAMQIEPNGLMAGNALTPLASGAPFFRGNVMENNGIDGLAVVTDRIYYDDPADNYQYIGPREAIVDGDYVNQSVDAVWDATDLTYVLRGTVVLGNEDEFFEDQGITQPNTSAFAPEISPSVSLTIQAALPGTLLADGETIPSPGQSVIVKMLSDETPNDAGSLTGAGSTGITANNNAGAGFAVGVDNDVDPTANPLIDPGVYSEIRVLGIPGDQTTGQQRVPVILTSLRDDTVGTTVRGVQMYDILNSDPVYQQVVNTNTATNSLTTPAAGDGGYIYIGGLSLTEYDPTDPFDGSIIDNADISYMTRIEVQGGGIVNTFNDISGTAGAPSLTATSWWSQLSGYLAPVNQLNAPMTFTIADSNLDDFSDAAVFVHYDGSNAIDFDWTGANGTIASQPTAATRSGLEGEPVFLYMYNDTVSNSAQGVHINPTTGDATTGNSVYQAVIQNVTFYNDPIAIQTIGTAYDGKNPYAGAEVLAMNDIFDGSTNAAGTGIAVNMQGQNEFSDLQYNLFYNNNTNIVSTTNDGDFEGNYGATYANPDFVGPLTGDATAENFELESDSPAIDAGRSEIGPVAGGNAIYPGTTLALAGGQVIGTRTDPYTLPTGEVPGKSDLFGEYVGVGIGLFQEFLGYDSRQIVTLPGSGYFSFPDEWEPVLTSDPNGYSGPSSNVDTYNYEPISGVRDILGYIRVPDPGAPSVGYGSNPFIDIGAYQYVNLHPPQVTAVSATETSTSSSGSTTVPFYTVSGEAGTNQTPLTLEVTFSEPIDPSTLTGTTVQLEELGVAPGTTQQFISLSGKLSYDSATNQLIISLGASGLSLVTDEYRLILYGSGSPVIANTQGVALDGEDLSNGDNPASGTQLPLPSGNGYPGGNFYDTFIINTTPPSVTPGTFTLSTATAIAGSDITNDVTPTFTGSITEPNPTLVPLAGQTAVVDVGLDINGTTYFAASQLPSNLSSYAQYLDPDAGTALTGASGDFTVTIGTDGAKTGLVTNTTGLLNLFPIYNVGTNGDLAPVPGTNQIYYVARVRVIDQSGNQSNPSASTAQLPFVVDTSDPTASFVSPTAGEVIGGLTDGQVQITITTDKNINPASITASAITVTSAGPDGILGDADDINIPINPASVSITYLDQGTGGKGAEQISFLTDGTLTNDLYEVTLNTGTGGITDLAGNPLASAASDTFAVGVPSLSTTLFVGAASYVTSTTATEGTRENPYPTIGAAMTAAVAGDVVAVLPGVYTENVTMKQFVRLYSAAPSSTDGTVFTTSTGNALATIIRAPAVGAGTATATVSAVDLQSFAGLETEIAGFTIAVPLVGNPALGAINPLGVGVYTSDSDILIDKDYLADGGVGINVATSGPAAQTPQIENDVIDGNIEGVQIVDNGTPSVANPVDLINNDFVYNTVGLQLSDQSTTPMEAYVASNIFFANFSQADATGGYAIYSVYPNKVTTQNNLFYDNGGNATSQVNANYNLGNGYIPANLGTTPDAQGNFVGNPVFVYPVDARPGSAGPADLFVDGDFELTASSAALDNAWEPTAIPTDLLGNSQVSIPNTGFGLPNYGPRDVGAFEYDGTGGGTVGGDFRVVTTSLVPVGGEQFAAGATLVTATSPTSIQVTFSGDVNQSSISATDLVLSGSADSSLSVKATSLTWIDADTVQFNLSGPLGTGTLDLSLPSGSIDSTTGQANLGYSDYVVIQLGTPPAPVNPTPMPVTTTPTPTPTSTTPTPTPTSTTVTTTPTSTPVSTTTSPAPAPAPTSTKKKHKVVHKVVAHPKPVKHTVAHKKEVAPAHKKEEKPADKKKAATEHKAVKVIKVVAPHHKKA
jgi:large repetitive protein